MRLPLAALLVVVPLAGCKKAAPPPDEPPPAAALTVGDPAPPITGADWLKGGPVAQFEPGKVYVVEFWATWCGPCMQAMPHLGRLAAAHGKDGLRVVAVSSADDDGNDRNAVIGYVGGRGAKYDFAWAFCQTRDTYEAWMGAAGQDGIPCSFVVDRAGKIAFIGHPAELDAVLPQVLAGTWKGLADLQRLEQANDELKALLGKVYAAGQAAEGGGEAAALAAARTAAGGVYDELPKFEAKYPDKAKLVDYRQQKLAVALQAGRMDAAKGLADPLLVEATASGDPRVLTFLAGAFASKELNPGRAHVGLATAAADTLLKVQGEDDLTAVMASAQVYYAAGDKAKADGLAATARRLSAGKPSAGEVEKALADFQR